MTREIKFRAWVYNPCYKFESSIWLGKYFMVDVLVIYLTKKGIRGRYIVNNYKNVRDYKTFKLMQFTGFTDKNNKEIYEGDIVKETKYYDYNRERISDITTEVVEDIRDISFGYLHPDYENSYDLEVIGNIYENPELIKND